MSQRLAWCAFLIGLAGCVEAFDEATTQGDLTTLVEGFESGTKTAYAAANVTLASGSWNLDDALIGTLASDVKHGSAAARVRNSGRLTMNFDRTSGAGTVTIVHATYGSDSAGTFALFVSRDHGASWSQVGSAVTTRSTLATASFTVNLTVSVRFQIRKTDGTSNRINLDDITITDPGGGGGGGGGTGGAGISVHTTLGLPTPASKTTVDDYLSVKSQYVISYNSDRKVPNWTSWQLDTTYLGSVSRTDTYRTDDTLPTSMPQASLADYSGSGWDRGHLCPSADRTKTTTANSETFYLTNMIPQSANNNRGPWEKLETYERSLATAGKELYIIAGGIYRSTRTIGSGVAVPTDTFKVIAVLDHLGDGVSAVTSSTRVIGVIMPNDDSRISSTAGWEQFRVSVRDIEDETGFDFLADVDPAIQDIVETRVDTQ